MVDTTYMNTSMLPLLAMGNEATLMSYMNSYHPPNTLMGSPYSHTTILPVVNNVIPINPIVLKPVAISQIVNGTADNNVKPVSSGNTIATQNLGHAAAPDSAVPYASVADIATSQKPVSPETGTGLLATNPILIAIISGLIVMFLMSMMKRSV